LKFVMRQLTHTLKKTFLLLALVCFSHSLTAQQWKGSATTSGEINRGGNIRANNLYFGKYGGGLLGDSDPYMIASVPNDGVHDLMIFGNNSTSALNLRLVDGSFKIGLFVKPNAEIYNNGGGYFKGAIGIGTVKTGSHKLAVEGSIGAREVKVKASGWSDFVFEKDYTLRPLEEVEQHINENGHLPEIPNEAEVAENGINLGEMNVKLLQKIEELTLYLIEQNKQNQSQQAEIEDLKQMNLKLLKRTKNKNK
ncbi:MAG: hypothetical protein OXH57_11240, partial [Ekhidna sp.]|nr:hypothetical protein [Ekhidna sp.]